MTLFAARPTETVSPTSLSIFACKRASCRAGDPPFNRSVPERSIQASSSDNGCTSGVRAPIRSMILRLSARYLAKSGRRTTASGQARSALNIGIAERTPKVLAI